ncbi:ABC transporter permease, partial [Leucobacter sp. M11]|nr:ABC transporter permease [Leucobacter sp. M11]
PPGSAPTEGGPPSGPPEGGPAEILAQLPQELPRVTLSDVVPTSEDDPNGVGATTAGIPLTVGALLSGVL